MITIKRNLILVFAILIVLGLILFAPRPLFPFSGGLGNHHELSAEVYGTEIVRYPNITFEGVSFIVVFSHLVVNATYRVYQVMMGNPINQMENKWNIIFTSANFTRPDFMPLKKGFIFQFSLPGWIGLDKINPFNGEWETRIMVSVF